MTTNPLIAKYEELQKQKPDPAASNPNAPTVKQINFIKILLEEKEVANPDALRETMQNPAYNKYAASDLISFLIKLPWKAKQKIPAVVIPQGNPTPTPQTSVSLDAGHYAVVDPMDGVLKFFKITIGKYDRWKGMRFLLQVAGERHLKITDRNERTRIYALIAKNPKEAMMLYGQKIGRCGHCHRQLTDAESRMKGIGPICEEALERRMHY